MPAAVHMEKTASALLGVEHFAENAQEALNKYYKKNLLYHARKGSRYIFLTKGGLKHEKL